MKKAKKEMLEAMKHDMEVTFKAVLENENYTVFTAENGKDELRVMDEEHIDLVLLDIMMPEMDGYEFTKLLREENNNLPILMVSAKQLPEDKKRGFLVGTDDYMTKPVDEDEMLLRIKALLRRAKIVNDRKIVIGEAVLDYDALTLLFAIVIFCTVVIAVFLSGIVIYLLLHFEIITVNGDQLSDARHIIWYMGFLCIFVGYVLTMLTTIILLQPLQRMIRRIRQLSAGDYKTILTDISTYNLSEQIRSCVLLLENRWLKKQIEFSLEFDEYNIHANEELLKQVWINLIDNAIKYSQEYGMIVIKIKETENAYKVSVANAGPEIPEESKDKIFNKFYQADESHASEGNGVGLAIVKKIVELHKGNVTVESENGITTFEIELNRK